jgi:hypothetical protein
VLSIEEVVNIFVSFPTGMEYWTEDVNFDFAVRLVFVPGTTRLIDVCI